jgi:hypothetical protein
MMIVTAELSRGSNIVSVSFTHHAIYPSYSDSPGPDTAIGLFSIWIRPAIAALAEFV